MKRVCVFCGSRDGARDQYTEQAKAMGEALVARNLTLVYGGGQAGLMGTVANAVLAAGGDVIGVIPHALVKKENAGDHLTELHLVDSMHERKAMMADLSDGFIAMPGGYGTIEEICEIVTWAQLGIHFKPCGLLNIEGYYDHLLAFVDHMVDEQFVPKNNRRLFLSDDDPNRLLDQFEKYESPATMRWLDSSQT